MSALPDDPMNQAAPPMPSMADRREMLIDSWFDGTLADDQFAELETSLLESSEARQEFWERATVHGLLREATKLRFSSADFGVTPAEPTSPSSVGEHRPMAVWVDAWQQLPLAVRRGDLAVRRSGGPNSQRRPRNPHRWPLRRSVKTSTATTGPGSGCRPRWTCRRGTVSRPALLHERWRNDGKRLAWESMGQYVDDIRLEVMPAAIPRSTR
jgi:hypothetical protein